MDEQKLILFLKAPRAGAVKTRLARTLGVEAACEAYRRLAETLLRNLAELPAIQFRFAPNEAVAEITTWLRPGWVSHPQGEGDLGQRLLAAFNDAFASGAKRVVIIGADCPMVVPEDIEAAWAALKENDLIIGPATDGGYWLIGLRAPQPSLFEGIAWSTDRVLQETLARAETAGLRVHLLRELTDVDTEPQWREFCDRTS